MTNFNIDLLKYDNDTGAVTYDDQHVCTWDDEAAIHYPEDLVWRRDIGSFVAAVFKAGMKQGESND